MTAYVRFILRHRVLVLVACGVITVLAGVSLSRAVMASSLMEMILGDSPAYRRYVRLVESFGSDEQLIVALEAPAWMSEAGGPRRVQRLVDRLAAMPEIARVESVLGAPPARGAERLDLDALAADPLAGGLLVSRDARHVAFLVNMVPDTQRSLEQTPAFVQRVVDVFAAEGLDPDTLHLGGQTATLGEVQTQMQRNVGVFLPAVAIFLLGTIYALFRRLWPAFVALAVGMIAIICPILLASIRTPKPWDPHGRRSLDAMLGAMRRVATRAPWPVIGVFAVFVVLSIYGTTRIEVETDLSKRMSAGSRFRRDTAYIDRHFAGTNALEVFVTPTTHGLDRNLSGRLARYHDALADLPDVGRVLSLVSVARSVGDAALLEPIPAAELMPALARLAAPELRPLVNGTDQLRFVVFITETGMARSYQIGLDADALAGTVFEGTAHVEVSGLAYLAGEWLDVNIRSQRTAVIVSFLAIAVVMVILFRSFGVGLWSMLPNLVPLLALGGIVGLAMDRTDSDLAMVALIAMGIAVDDTIHFLTRYRHETRRGGSRKEAIERTFGYAGRAIAMTSIIFAVGFAPFAFSGYLTIRLLGLLLPAVMVIAMLADLLLLPALLTVGAIRFSAPRPPEAR